MYNSKYYTCEQIDQRLLEGYYDDAVAAGYTGSKAQYLAGLLKAINYSANPTITADKVVYNPAISGLTPKNIQDAIDELANKKANSEDVDSKIQTEQERVNAELDKKFDKENIAQEFGDSDDKVVSQFALPFRYIQSEEFIFAKVDRNYKLLFGIQWDGTPVFGKTSAVEDRLQSQVNLLADKITTILGDDDTTSAIDTLKELKDFFANIDNTQTLTSILANINSVSTKLGEDIKNLQDTKVDKEEGKSLIEDEVKECFRIIENEEFLKAIVDSDDKVLFGFYRATGEPYYPLNEMYHVIQNDEYFAAWVTTNDKVVLGLRRDGEIIGEINAVNSLKQVISQLQSDVAALKEKVGTIDNLQELLDVFSLQNNEEYLAVEQDAEGKILSSTNHDGSHYIHNIKSETIPEEFSHIEDPEGRTEITTDAEDKILGYRDSEGTRHEHKISVSHINLSDEAAKEVNEAFKSAYIKMDNPSDFSNDSHIELPIPRVAAQVRLYAPKLPISKQDDIEAEIEYNDKDGNYFKKPVILNAQGNSSMGFYVKNMAIDINDGSEIKFGDFPTQDSFHLKKYYIDIFRGQCIVGYHLMEQVYKSHPIGKQYPYEYNYSNESESTGLGDVKKDFFTGAKCHPDGFPIIITWVNTKSKEETWMGIYAWNLKKSKEVFFCDKKKSSNILLDGNLNGRTLWGGNVDWTMFEIRNPKSLIDINGNKYDGDNPVEPSNTDSFSKSVKDSITRLSSAMGELKANQNKETFEKYFLVNPFIDYYLVSQVLYNYDGFDKNWLWETLNSQQWFPNLYDVDSIFGQSVNGAYFEKRSIEGILGTADDLPSSMLVKLYESEIKNRYWELKNKSIFTTDNIVRLLNDWLNRIGYDNISKEIKAYPETPSYRKSFLNSNWELVYYTFLHGFDNYDNTKEYTVGEECVYLDYKFKALNSTTGNPPLDSTYNNNPIAMGMFNSVSRVKNWLDKRIAFLDNYYKI